MSVGAGIEAMLPALRAQAESTHIDSCTIDRLTSEWDEAQQRSVTTWATIHAAIPCALTDPSASDRVLVTDEVTTRVDPLVKVAHDVEGIEPDDRVTLASGPVVYVTDVPVRTNQVQRRLKCRWVK